MTEALLVALRRSIPRTCISHGTAHSAPKAMNGPALKPPETANSQVWGSCTAFRRPARR